MDTVDTMMSVQFWQKYMADVSNAHVFYAGAARTFYGMDEIWGTPI